MCYWNTESSIQLQPKGTCCRHVPITTTQEQLITAPVPSLSLGIVWSTVELGTAIICGCLPTYGPLLHDPNLPAPIRAWFASAFSTARGSPSNSAEHHSSRKTHGDSVAGYKKFSDDTYSENVHLSDTEGGRWPERALISPAHPLKAVTAERQVEGV